MLVFKEIVCVCVYYSIYIYIYVYVCICVRNMFEVDLISWRRCSSVAYGGGGACEIGLAVARQGLS